MKRIIFAVAIVTQLGFAGPAMATTVDFSALVETADITNSPYTLSDVTFTYDDFGGGYFAAIDPAGIFGDTYGNLIFDFSAPATALNFDFSLLGATSDIEEALFIAYDNNNNGVGEMLVAASFIPYDPNDLSIGGDAYGTLNFSGAAFNRAQMFFSLDAPYFTISNMDYTPAPVPEPATLLLMATGLLGFGGGKRLFKRKRG